MKSPTTAAIAPPITPEARQARRWAWLIIGLFLLGGIAYSWSFPPSRRLTNPFTTALRATSPRAMVCRCKTRKRPARGRRKAARRHSTICSPGWATRFIDQSDFAELAVRNPRANIGDPLYPGNKNFMLYAGRWQPLQGQPGAARRALALAAAGCADAVGDVAAGAATPFPRRQTLPLLAMALVAAIPQFLFLSASFSNDNVVIAASTFTLFWLARLLAKSDDVRVTWWEWGVLGVALGAAGVEQAAGAGAVPAERAGRALAGVAAAHLACIARRHAFHRHSCIVIAGWWYWRNIALYGDWSGLSHLMEINGRRERGIDWRDFWPEFAGLRYSAWGVFGWFNILLPEWFYQVMDAVTVIGLVGAGLATGNGHSSRLIRHQSSDAPHSRYPSRLARIVLCCGFGWQ
jgi:hypothetical protein